MKPSRAFPVLLALGLAGARASAQDVTVQVDAGAARRPIRPAIYGVHFADTATLLDLNATVNRYGGNSVGRYNWQQNVDNRGGDWFFQSIPYWPDVAGAEMDAFVQRTKAGGAEPILSMPMVGFVARTNANRDVLFSFPTDACGPQTATDAAFPLAGNGCVGNVDVYPCQAGRPMVGALVPAGCDPTAASLPADDTFQQGWMQHIRDTWGPASTTGLKYWGLDNEPSIWHAVYWDVHPQGATAAEMRAKMIAYGSRIKSVDPNAQVLGPEEWGWDGFFYSGRDQQLWSEGQCGGFDCPDYAAHGEYVPYLLSQLKQHEVVSGTRVLDMVTLHHYPGGGEVYSDQELTVATQLLRNRSTRALWDPAYVDESWIGVPVRLIPRLKEWVAAHDPGLKIGLTEYNWGAEGHISGATAQADLLGIFGREGLDMAARWTTGPPPVGTPAYNAFKMYRNYDGARSTFGETSVFASAPDPDQLAAFAAERADGALTVMLVNKVLAGSTGTSVQLANFPAGTAAEVWQLTSANAITRLVDAPVAGGSAISLSLPAQSITLLVVRRSANAPPEVSVSDASVVEGASGATTAWFAVTLSKPWGVAVTVDYDTDDGTAVAGSDYAAAAGTVTIPAGETSALVGITVVGDADVEGNETFGLGLLNPQNATIGDGGAVGTIVDDDPAAGAATADFLMLGQSARATLAPAQTERWLKLRLVPGRSYHAAAWAPGTDPGETPVALDLAWFLDDGQTAAEGTSASAVEPLPGAEGHVGASTSLIPSAGQCVSPSGCTFRLRLQAAGVVAPFDAWVRVVETTLTAPYWAVATAAGYDAAPQVRNNSSSTIAVTFTAFGPAGNVVCSSVMSVPANAMTTFGVSGGAPGCAVTSGFGSALLAHHGPPGSITGNITTFSGVSGLSFDAPFRPRNTWTSLRTR